MPTPAICNRSGRAVFLCWHSVAPEGPTYLTVSADVFERQLAALEAHGFGYGGLEELDGVVAGADGPPTVFLTFDDGFLDNFETVLPILRAHRARAFVFVLPPLVDGAAPLRWPEVAADSERFATMRSVNWTMVEQMREGGFVIGSHTLSHPHLPELGETELREELSASRQALVDRLGACDTIAYPFGEWSPRVAAAARDCGYRFAFSLPTETGQRGADPWSIPRVNVDYRDRGRRFESKLSPLGRRALLSPRVTGGRRSLQRFLKRDQ
jgi:peptidoglycan/xylan/chitin deacetylase (PgdA/CDA1 family)